MLVFFVYQCRERSTPNCSTDTRTASMLEWRWVRNQSCKTWASLTVWTFGANHRRSWLSTAPVHLRAGRPGAEDGGRLRDQAEEARFQRSPVATGDDHGGPEGISGAQWHWDQGLEMKHYNILSMCHSWAFHSKTTGRYKLLTTFFFIMLASRDISAFY